MPTTDVPTFDLQVFGELHRSSDLPALGEAAAAAWGARVRISRFGALHVVSEAVDLDATPADRGTQPFSGSFRMGPETALNSLHALSEALVARNIAHRLELVVGGVERARIAHAWPDAQASAERSL